MLFYFTADHKRVVFFLILFICLFFLFLTTFPRYPTERSGRLSLQTFSNNGGCSPERCSLSVLADMGSFTAGAMSAVLPGSLKSVRVTLSLLQLL